MSQIQDQLRREVAKLLEEKTVDLFLGYEDADLPLKTVARFIRTAQDADRLVWNRSCTANLAALLPQAFKKPAGIRGDWTPPRVGVLAKGCVSRSIVGLIKAHQIPREGLFILGVGCDGMIDRHHATQLLGIAELVEAEIDDGALRLRATGGAERVVDVSDVLADACSVCRFRAAVLADATIGDAPDTQEAAERYASVATFESKEMDERWAEFAAEISRCVRCYACREACPNCYCTECFADETEPKWIGATTDLSDLILFHLGRAFHQAGRCVDCGACVAACPQGIDLRLLNQKINQDVEALFGGDVSVSLDEPEPLCQFRMDDDQDFMTEP